MGKIKIILAETEGTVLSALELKFVYELRDSADIEIISSEEYFEKFFAVPQKADVLVIDEELYTTDLKKHDIKRIFLLCENADPGRTEDLSVERVNKYSSPKVVMNQVMRGNSIAAKEHKPIVALVCSANGGAGKTTVALGVCASLAKDFKRVLYINAERINTFQGYLNNTANIPNSIIGELSTANGDIFKTIRHVVKKEGFDYLPPFSTAISSLGLHFSVYEKIAMAAKASGEYDVIVIDTDTVFDETKASMMTKADRVLMVVNQTQSSLYATNVLLSNISCNNTSKYFFVCNNFDKSKNNALLNTNIKPKFIVNEYIAHFDGENDISIENLANRADIQKTAYLLI